MEIEKCRCGCKSGVYTNQHGDKTCIDCGLPIKEMGISERIRNSSTYELRNQGIELYNNPKTREQSYAYFELGSSQGDGVSKYYLGRGYCEGDGISLDAIHGKKLITDAIAMGSKDALLYFKQIKDLDEQLPAEIMDVFADIEIPSFNSERTSYPAVDTVHPEESINSNPMCEIYKRIIKYTLRIQGGRSLGTAFIYENGLIGTNYHVVKRAHKGKLQITGRYHKQFGYKVLNLTLITYSEKDDVAILKSEDEFLFQGGLQLGDSSKLIPGENISTIGLPVGDDLSFWVGTVAAASRNYPEYRYSELLVLNICTNHGNSGGPCLDSKGLVVGIATSSPTESLKINVRGDVELRKQIKCEADISLPGVSFAVTSNTLKKYIDKACAKLFCDA